MSANLSDEQLSNLSDVLSLFNKYGDDNDDTSAKELLREVVRTVAGLPDPTEDQLHDMVTLLTSKGFPHLVPKVKLIAEEEKEFRVAFRLFDLDGSGFISVAELKHGVKKLGLGLSDEEVEEMVKEADLDGDGQVCYEEFVALVTSIP